MSYIYKLAGENLELAEAELKGFLRSQGISEDPSRTGSIAETEAEPAQLKRLALTHEICAKEAEIESTGENFDISVKRSFRVSAENFTDEDVSTSRVEEKIGEAVSDEENSVDLENPDTVLKAYITDQGILIGRLKQDINRGLFEGRRNDKRPFSSPVSLDPVLARVLVNLSETEPGQYVLDPFCGTGGILIEAGLCGIGVKGFDVQGEMVEGSKKNLEEYGIINYDITQENISELEDADASAVITDLPYGKSSKKTETAVEDFLSFLDEYEGRAVFMYNMENIGGLEADFSVYVHGSLTRYIFIAD